MMPRTYEPGAPLPGSARSRGRPGPPARDAARRRAKNASPTLVTKAGDAVPKSSEPSGPLGTGKCVTPRMTPRMDSLAAGDSVRRRATLPGRATRRPNPADHSISHAAPPGRSLPLRRDDCTPGRRGLQAIRRLDQASCPRQAARDVTGSCPRYRIHASEPYETNGDGANESRSSCDGYACRCPTAHKETAWRIRPVRRSDCACGAVGARLCARGLARSRGAPACVGFGFRTRRACRASGR